MKYEWKNILQKHYEKIQFDGHFQALSMSINYTSQF